MISGCRGGSILLSGAVRRRRDVSDHVLQRAWPVDGAVGQVTRVGSFVNVGDFGGGGGYVGSGRAMVDGRLLGRSYRASRGLSARRTSPGGRGGTGTGSLALYVVADDSFGQLQSLTGTEVVSGGGCDRSRCGTH